MDVKIQTKISDDQLLGWGRSVCNAEADAINRVSSQLGVGFCRSVNLILSCRGKVVVTGLGKSGYIARKMASTLSSTGTPSFYLHPAEALHGDFGMIQECDCLVAIAHGGETREVLGVAKFAQNKKVPIISVTGNLTSSLAKMSTSSVDGSIEEEADGLGLAPTASSTVALALCDAISVCVMKGRGFTERQFADLHPGGSLGKRFALVSTYLNPTRLLKTVGVSTLFTGVIEAITDPNYGIVPVVDDKNRLIGAISDGDIRRALLRFGAETLSLNAGQIMSEGPLVVEPSDTVIDAISIMEQNSIMSLFVCKGKDFLGLLRLHDLIVSKIL